MRFAILKQPAAIQYWGLGLGFGVWGLGFRVQGSGFGAFLLPLRFLHRIPLQLPMAVHVLVSAVAFTMIQPMRVRCAGVFGSAPLNPEPSFWG